VVIKLYFPTAIFYKDKIFDELELDFLKEKSNNILNKIKENKSNWYSQLKNTFNQYNLIDDPHFEVLLKVINEYVTSFNHAHGSKLVYDKPYSAWLNLYNEGDYQEFHNHASHRYSAIFIIEGEKNIDKATPICFNNPYQDMLPPNGVEGLNELTFQQYSFNALENSLIIFRSHLQHCVQKHIGKKQRISLALNYN
tara:strand:- start:1619 stop:2206 length:588 start_codon:yes stop_codon:yes gene_type:complete